MADVTNVSNLHEEKREREEKKKKLNKEGGVVNLSKRERGFRSPYLVFCMKS
jgi:hypothetical protein